MAELLRELAQRAQQGQWKLEDLPWDEPLKFNGRTVREQTLRKLDSLTVTETMFSLELSIRQQLGENMRHMIMASSDLLACVRWHDTDTQRHLWTLRRLLHLIQDSGSTIAKRSRHALHPPSPLRLIHHNPRDQQLERLAVDLLVRAAVVQYLYGFVGKQSRIPHLRAVYAACADDGLRHKDYLNRWLKHRLRERNRASLKLLQMTATATTARMTDTVRPSLQSFANLADSRTSEVAVGLFSAVSSTMLKLGSSWRGYPARLVHDAPRSPWLLWVLR